MIFITSIWPIIINTAVGVQHLRRTTATSRGAAAQPIGSLSTRSWCPSAAPYIFTGLRIGIGLAWLVIVAAEMLTGGVGIGFFIWDAWNSSRLSDIVVALVYIGVVGFVLDRVAVAVGQRSLVRRGA